MNTKRLVVGSVVGAIVLHLVGYLLFQRLLADFYAANAGTATGVNKEPQVLWAVIVGNLSYAVLLTLATGWARATSLMAGFRIGATVQFLAWLGTDLILFGISNTTTLNLALVDPLVELVHGGLAGAAIVAVTARLGSSA